MAPPCLPGLTASGCSSLCLWSLNFPSGDGFQDSQVPFSSRTLCVFQWIGLERQSPISLSKHSVGGQMRSRWCYGSGDWDYPHAIDPLSAACREVRSTQLCPEVEKLQPSPTPEAKETHTRPPTLARKAFISSWLFLQ